METFNTEFSRLKGVAYLDHTGATLYSESQARAISEDLCSNLYGNPHALNSSSKLSSDIVEHTREKVLSHFNTDSSEYSVIFTTGATASLKMVAENFLWDRGDFVYLTDNHTSVLGMRELASVRGAQQAIALTPHQAQELFEGSFCNSGQGNSLFVYPAECNFSGKKYPLKWVADVHAGALNHGDHSAVMLDAAAFVATNNLDLSKVRPDFVCISFYKIFGLPTGLGALLVRNGSEKFLKKRYYGGGTVLMAMSEERKHVPRPLLHEWFEDGTISFLSIGSLRHGFDSLARLVPGGMVAVEKHTFQLARRLHHELAALRHGNGAPVARLYCDTDFEDSTSQGPIVNFNILRPNGTYVGFSEVLQMCNLFDVHIRTGCFCNPGACQRHLGLTKEDLYDHFEAGHVCGDSVDLVAGRPTGSVRASLGYCSSPRDVDKLLELVRKCFVHLTIPSTTPTLRSLTSPALQAPKLCRLFLYPIKSCGAQEVASWPLDSRGLTGDRSFMIATEAGVALTQKHEPKMCMVKPCLDLEQGIMTLSFPGLDDVSVPYLPECPSDTEGQQSRVCGARVSTSDCGDHVAEWLSTALDRPGLRLLRQWPSDTRTQKKNASAGLSLANQAQFLLVGLGSLAWLEQKVATRQQNGEEICEGDNLLLRFRSNLVVTGLQEFEETKWKAIKIGSVLLKSEGPCTRCQMVCIDQGSGMKTTEPLSTLTASSEGRMQFGSYFSASTSSERLRLYTGSPVTPVELEN